MVEENKEATKQSPLEEAKAILADIRKEKEELLVLRNEQANKMLGGIADAGQAPVVKVQTSKEYADEVMSGKIKAKAI